MRTALSLFTIAALLIGGCAGSEPTSRSAAHATIEDAADKTRKKGTAAVTASYKVDTGSERFELQMAGTASLDRSEMSGVLNLRGGGDDTTLDFSIVPPKMYVADSGTEQWRKVDLPGGPLAATDASDALDYMEALVGDVEHAGTENVNGVRTAHYKVEIDGKAIVNELRGDTVATDVWVGDDGLIHRIAYVVNGEATNGNLLNAELQFSEFGTAERPQAPSIAGSP